jgi:hypothetical protein
MHVRRRRQTAESLDLADQFLSRRHGAALLLVV